MGVQVPRPTRVVDSLGLGGAQGSEFQQAFQLILLEVSALHLGKDGLKSGHMIHTQRKQSGVIDGVGSELGSNANFTTGALRPLTVSVICKKVTMHVHLEVTNEQ